ncbi:helix-turn-helix domain-containing protein [Streptosporangium roseum]|uniref:helix-turn-helix domain-containing protein n=1 Tax=Streptosporangium roseum TaxID=2001 RepID=UPI000691B294|nr:helix-turn-helix transcriptional regulator [Streptosporangium roseum]
MEQHEGEGAALTPTQVTANRVRHYRDALGWSAQELARRCAAAGMPHLDRAVLSNFENGRRTTIRLDEVLTLAWVLGVPPVMLMVPLGWADEVAITPTVAVHPGLALRWIAGEVKTPTSDRKVAAHVDRSVHVKAVQPLALYEQLTRTQETLAKAEAHLEEIKALDGVPAPDLMRLTAEYRSRLDLADRRWKNALKAMADTLNLMVTIDVRPPAIWRTRYDAMLELDLLLEPEAIQPWEGWTAPLESWYRYAPQDPDVTDLAFEGEERPVTATAERPTTALHEVLPYDEELQPVVAAVRQALEQGVPVRMIQDLIPFVDMLRRAFP